MELVPYTDEDIGLIEELECDPETMRELGGPVARQEIPAIHGRRLATIAAGEWYFKIVPGDDGEVAGTVGIWLADWREVPADLRLPVREQRAIQRALPQVRLRPDRGD